MDHTVYCFRVPTPDLEMFFAAYADAHAYMSACLHAECIDYYDGTRWHLRWCEDRADMRPAKRGGYSSRAYYGKRALRRSEPELVE